MAPEDLLLAARDLMRDAGFTRWALVNGEGVCLLGALNWASKGSPERHHGRVDAYGPLSDTCHNRFGVGVAAANNMHIADIDEACDVLEAAAKRAAREGVVDDG